MVVQCIHHSRAAKQYCITISSRSNVPEVLDLHTTQQETANDQCGDRDWLRAGLHIFWFLCGPLRIDVVVIHWVVIATSLQSREARRLPWLQLLDAASIIQVQVHG